MRCLITGAPWPGPGPYSPEGLRRLDRRLKSLQPLPFTQQQLLEEAAARSVKMSVQGMQPKLSAVLRVTQGRMELVNEGGRFILKPPHPSYPELPENETLTLSLAATLDIEVPVHGLLLNEDRSHSFFIRRFDRIGLGRQPVEDFAQLSGASRDTKYNSSTERLIEIIDLYCTFPAIERLKLFERLLCAFLTGNEDMHLKNWSLVTRNDKVELAPAYDLLNTTIPNPRSREEVALPLRGKKSNLTGRDFWHYLASERLQIAPSLLERTKRKFSQVCRAWPDLIEASFLSPTMRSRYRELLAERSARLGLD